MLSGGGRPANVDSMGGGCDDFVSLFVINSIPTSNNSSRFDELLEVTVCDFAGV